MTVVILISSYTEYRHYIWKFQIYLGIYYLSQNDLLCVTRDVKFYSLTVACYCLWSQLFYSVVAVLQVETVGETKRGWGWAVAAC